ADRSSSRRLAYVPRGQSRSSQTDRALLLDSTMVRIGCKEIVIPTIPATNPDVMTQATFATRPLVSVVTPFYNTAKYLAQCIEGVLTQSYPEFEYILLDNCSTDGSREIAQIYARQDPR